MVTLVNKQAKLPLLHSGCLANMQDLSVQSRNSEMQQMPLHQQLQVIEHHMQEKTANKPVKKANIQEISYCMHSVTVERIQGLRLPFQDLQLCKVT